MAQKVIDNVAVLTTPQLMMQAIDDNFDELYAGSAGGGGGGVSDEAYDATSWNAVGTVAPSKNAVRDKVVAMDAAIATNTAKETNVSTNLAEGTATETTVTITSSDGTDAVLQPASSTRAGLLTIDKFNEIGAGGGETAQERIDVAETITALKAIDITTIEIVELAGYYLKYDGGQGRFLFDTSDLSTKVAADTRSAIYVPPDTDSTGASGAWVRQYSGNLNIRWFGITGTSHSVPIQAAVDFSSSLSPKTISIFFPAGDYTIDTTINISSSIELKGEGFMTYGTRIFNGASNNDAMFRTTSNARFLNLTLYGSNAGGNEVGVNVLYSNTYFDNVAFFNSTIGISFSGSTPSFYNSIQNCRFQDATKAHILVNNTSDAGVDLIIGHTRFLGDMPTRCLDFNLGLGSIIASDVQISVTGSGPTAQLVLFNTPAPLYGGCQFTNCVFESGGTSVDSTALYLLGTASVPWKEMHFDNCLFTSSTGPAVVFTATKGGTFTNCTFSSSNSSGMIWFASYGENTGINMIGCRWESIGTGECITALGDSTIELSIISPNWEGSTRFIDFSLVSYAQLLLYVIGGKVGTHSDPILPVSYKNFTVGSGGGGEVSDETYDATSWNAVGTVAPSKNAVRDKVVAMDAAIATNTAKVSFDSTSSDKLATIEEGAEVNSKNFIAGDSCMIRRGSSDYTIPSAGASIKLTWDTVDYDALGDSNSTDFTAPVTGLYQANLILKVTNATSANNFVAAGVSIKNLSSVITFNNNNIIIDDSTIASDVQGISSSIILYMEAGFKAYAEVYMGAGSGVRVKMESSRWNISLIKQTA